MNKEEKETKKETMLAKIKKHKSEIAVFAGTVAGLLVLKKLSDRFLYEHDGLNFVADLYQDPDLDENGLPKRQSIHLQINHEDRIFHKEHPYKDGAFWSIDDAEDIANGIMSLVNTARKGKDEEETE